MRRFVLVPALLAAGFLLARPGAPTRAEVKYLDPGTILQTMSQWTSDLGVNCGFCHTSEPPRTIESLAGKTAPADELATLLHRRIALDMEGMMRMVNMQQKAPYTCKTCHQGKAEIETKKT